MISCFLKWRLYLVLWSQPCVDMQMMNSKRIQAEKAEELRAAELAEAEAMATEEVETAALIDDVNEEAAQEAEEGCCVVM